MTFTVAPTTLRVMARVLVRSKGALKRRAPPLNDPGKIGGDRALWRVVRCAILTNPVFRRVFGMSNLMLYQLY